MPSVTPDADDLATMALGFLVGAALGQIVQLVVLRTHPAAVEGETIVEAESVVVDAERELRRHG